MEGEAANILKVAWLICSVMFVISVVCVCLAFENHKTAKRYLEGWRRADEDSREFKAWLVSTAVKNGAVYTKEPGNVIKVEFK